MEFFWESIIRLFIFVTFSLLICAGCSGSGDYSDSCVSERPILSGILEIEIPQTFDFLTEISSTKTKDTHGFGKYIPSKKSIEDISFFYCDYDSLIFSFTKGFNPGLLIFSYEKNDFESYIQWVKDNKTSTDYIKGSSDGEITLINDKYNGGDAKKIKLNLNANKKPFDIDLRINWKVDD